MEVASLVIDEGPKEVLTIPSVESSIIDPVATSLEVGKSSASDGLVGLSADIDMGVVSGNTKPDEKSALVGEMEILESTESKDLPDPISNNLGDTQGQGSNLSKSVSIAQTVQVEDDTETDVIVLDDDDDLSGLSETKRPRKDNENDDDIMEVDENGLVTSEEESAGKVIRKMARQDLEDLVLAKIVEAIVAHTEVGQLRAKVLELQMQKDKMASKMGIMMKQVAELSNAINMVMENESRDPKNRIGKPHVIRFNRSVGLQTSIEPSVRSAPPRIIRVPEPSQNTNGMKNFGSSAGGGKTPVQSGFSIPHAAKRVYQGNKMNTNAGGGNRPGANSSPSPVAQRKVYSAASGPPRMYPIAPKPASQQNNPATATPASQNIQPGVVDLTDDDPPSTIAATTSGSAPTTTIINGVQYQIINRGAAQAGGVLSGPGQKYIMTSASGQTRPMMVPQLPTQQLSGNQQIMLRGMNNNSPVTIVQRPAAPRTQSNGNIPRVAAAIPVRSGGSLLGAAAAPKRFVLPPLPATPAPKSRNDQCRPPPKPELTLNEQTDGIVLSWNLPDATNMAEVTTYQIFACQESLTINSNRPSQWKRVGDVKALPLPMACTLSQFTEENRYHFIVRGIDVFGRVGPFCDPQNILLRKKK